MDPGEAVRVGLVVHHPAGRPEHLLRRPAPRRAHRLDVAVVRCGGLGQVGDLGEPVVHLEVDVAVVVGGPRRGGGVVPDALEVGGQRTGPRGSDQQVAAVLEEERFERPVGGARSARVPGQQLVGRQVGQLLADVEGDPVEERPMVVYMGSPDLLVRRSGRFVHRAGDRVVRVVAAVGRIAVGVVGGSGEGEPGAVGIGDGQRAVGPGGDAAATRTDPDLGLEAQPVVLQRAPYGQPVSSCGRGEVAARRGVAQGEGDLSRAVRSEPPGDDAAGVGDEELPGVVDVPVGVGDGGERCAQVEGASVGGVGGGRGMRQIEQQVTEDLVGAVAAACLAELRGDRVRIDRTLAVEALLHCGEGTRSGGGPVPEVVPLGGAGAAGPQRLLVEGEPFRSERSVDARAQGATADGQ